MRISVPTILGEDEEACGNLWPMHLLVVCEVGESEDKSEPTSASHHLQPCLSLLLHSLIFRKHNLSILSVSICFLSSDPIDLPEQIH